jgi:hypothetical protein
MRQLQKASHGATSSRRSTQAYDEWPAAFSAHLGPDGRAAVAQGFAEAELSLVEHHSCCINQNVRYQFANMGIVGEMPERYERLKQAARVKAKVLEPELQKAGETEFLPILSAA